MPVGRVKFQEVTGCRVEYCPASVDECTMGRVDVMNVLGADKVELRLIVSETGAVVDIWDKVLPIVDAVIFAVVGVSDWVSSTPTQ